jgi:DNA-binding NarL/FixJ family response regulator
MSAEQKTSVFLVDDHPMVRAGLAQLLQSSGFTVLGEAGSGPETLAHPALSERPLVIVDLSLGEDSGIELIRRLCRLGIAVLVYSMHEGAQAIRHALEAGAGGYATKRDAAESLIDAVHTVHAGSRYLSPRAHAALQRASPVDAMSDRQREIFRLMGRGCSNEEIARHLGISVRTLESYCVRIMDKLGVQGTKELRQLAIREAANGGGV